MATVNFSIRGKANPTKIYVRFIASREIDYKIATPLSLNPNYFNNKTGKVRKVASFIGRDKMELQLNELRSFLIDRYNNDLKIGKVSGSGW